MKKIKSELQVSTKKKSELSSFHFGDYRGCPVQHYFSSLSKTSRASITACLKIAAEIWGYSSYKDIDWSKLDYQRVSILKSALAGEVKVQRFHSKKKNGKNEIVQKLIHRREYADFDGPDSIRSRNDILRKPRTVNTYLSYIKGVALAAYRLGYINTETYNAIKYVEGVRGSRKTNGRALSRDEISQLITRCGSSCRGVRNAAIIAILVACGLRRSELAELKIDNVDFESHRLRYVGKGNVERDIKIPENAMNKLIDWVENVRGYQSGFLFNRFLKGDEMVHGVGITGRGIYEIVTSAGRSASIKPAFSAHDLRRSYAQLLYDGGLKLEEIQDLMGHSCLETTRLYLRLPGKHEAKSAEILSDAF